MSIETFKDFVYVRTSALNMKKWKHTTGMMGSFPTGEMLARNGTALSVENADEFGMEWQARENLFHNADGVQFPQACEMPTVSAQRKLAESSIKGGCREGLCWS